MEALLTIGLDIGSTKLVAARYQHGRAETVLTSQQERSRKFCLAFNDQERLFDEAAEFQFNQNPESTIFGRGEKDLDRGSLKTSFLKPWLILSF